MGLDQKFSLALLPPLKTQHHRRGGGGGVPAPDPPTHLKGALPPPPPPRSPPPMEKQKRQTTTAALVDLHSREAKGRAANGDRPIGATGCRREQQIQGDMPPPPPPRRFGAWLAPPLRCRVLATPKSSSTSQQAPDPSPFCVPVPRQANAQKWEEKMMELRSQLPTLRKSADLEAVELTPEERQALDRVELIERHTRNVRGLADEGGLRGDAPLSKQEYDLVREKGTAYCAKHQVRAGVAVRCSGGHAAYLLPLLNGVAAHFMSEPTTAVGLPPPPTPQRDGRSPE